MREKTAAVINYSTSVNIISSLLDTDQDKAQIITNINNMEYLSTSTATADALQILPILVVSRQMVSSDGESNNRGATIAEAELLKNQEVSIIIVGITSGIDHVELEAIS